MKQYNPQEIEKKWQKIWDEKGTFKADNNSSKPKYYALVEFPYPSGAGLHVGHPRSYTALDIIARKRRMEGYNVLYPIGWDAFGLPAENYAIKHKIHPKEAVKINIQVFKAQLKSLGISFDWDREFSTTDEDYYKWTQWQFLQFYKHGLAYKAKTTINWCTSCKVGLANEEVEGGKCERCGGEIEKREKEQWMLKMTAYADKLIEGLEDTNFVDRVKTAQINWIGKSTGAEVDFKVKGTEKSLRIFTTRPDTLYGVTFMAIAPEHPILQELSGMIENMPEIEEYQGEAQKKSEFERVEIAKDKTGVRIKGISAVNPLSGEEVQVWVADYVMMGYGTGAIMAVPAHDQRDWEFAKKFNIPIVEVIKGGDIEKEAYTGEGEMINSGILNGMSNKADSIKKVVEYLEQKGIGKATTNYRLQDWVFSRQRFWGEPIPMINCEKCGYVPVPENQLPVTLPDVAHYEPTDNGESPLANITEWVETTCPQCGGHAHRETDTMPNWAGSSWYWLRYMDAKNDKEFVSQEALGYWNKVDWYNGGMEHATRHLLYARFWHRFLYDIGLVPFKEPFNIRTAHGMILGENGEKMSKSKGNVINPDEIVNTLGADTLRTYEMFIGDFEKTVAWSENGVKGCRRFLDRVWKLQEVLVDDDSYSKELETKMHQTIKKVTLDYEKLKFNTAIAAMMELVNKFYDAKRITRGEYKTLIVLLNPTASHITEELWQMLGFEEMLNQTSWPEYDEAKTIEDTVELVFQVNGKIIERVSVPAGSGEDVVFDEASKSEKVQKILEGKAIVKKIFVIDKLMNVVVK